ncbi:MAG: YkgJ family cysteine cluster protein [Candidatus Xenobiia bacterium LiM19]
MSDFNKSSCNECGENCCRNFYIVLEEVRDRDWIRWLSYHQGVRIVNHGKGKLQVWFDYPCSHLQEDGSCAIYRRRPKLCREFVCPKSEKEEKPVKKKRFWLFSILPPALLLLLLLLSLWTP